MSRAWVVCMRIGYVVGLTGVSCLLHASASAHDVSSLPLQILDDSKNWWKLRNSRGSEGFAPYTIVQVK